MDPVSKLHNQIMNKLKNELAPNMFPNTFEPIKNIIKPKLSNIDTVLCHCKEQQQQRWVNAHQLKVVLEMTRRYQNEIQALISKMTVYHFCRRS
jgi:glucan phosphorylase